jgi:hypothetical protein
VLSYRTGQVGEVIDFNYDTATIKYVIHLRGFVCLLTSRVLYSISLTSGLYEPEYRDEEPSAVIPIDTEDNSESESSSESESESSSRYGFDCI